MMNMSGQGVHINEIITIEVEKANRIKAILTRDSDDNIKKLFKGFGARLKKIKHDKCKRCFITTHYSFITLSVFHYASIINSNKCNKNFSKTFFDMEKLLQYYLIPNTKHKEVILNLYDIVGTALEHIGVNLFKEKFLDQMSLNQISGTEKLWAFICNSNSSFKKEARDFLDPDTFSKYSNLGKDLITAKSYADTGSDYIKSLSQKCQSNIKDAYLSSEMAISVIKNISDGLLAYILKFEQNTTNPSEGKVLTGYIKHETKTFTTWTASTNLTNPVTDIMEGTITDTTDTSIKTLKHIFPPAAISSLVSSIAATIIQISTKSKGYGVINRHGITGQIRANLLKNYLEMFAVFIRNHYSNIFSLNNETEINNCCDRIIETIELFSESYKSSIEMLPNKDKHRSLYFYLSMYADPNQDFNLNKEKIKAWNKSKVGNIYNDE